MTERLPPSESKDLFKQEDASPSTVSTEHTSPLAVRMRPQSVDEVIGQDHILGEGKLLRRVLDSGQLPSMIFYGPPGVGKTTLSRLISKYSNSRFVPLNAVASNVAELRKVIQDAKKLCSYDGTKTILFVDEIHRFNKSQQDVLMPEAETGAIVLVGATTHNPSFSINGPLLSRSTVFELKPLDEEALKEIILRALSDKERGLGSYKVHIEENAITHLIKASSGDARRALNSLEVGVLTTEPDASGMITFSDQVAEESSQKRIVYYDKDEDYHYDTISAFIKSMRGSDPDSAVYWLAKMLYGGEDPRFLMRRMLIFASEDIGNADPQALILASSGLNAVEFVGMPEARIILSQIVVYLSLAPKSNASYVAIDDAMSDVEKQKSEEVPNALRDKHYSGAKKLGHGKGYIYPHGKEESALPVVKQSYKDSQKSYYQPRKIAGFEKVLSERLEQIKKKRSKN